LRFETIAASGMIKILLEEPEIIENWRLKNVDLWYRSVLVFFYNWKQF